MKCLVAAAWLAMAAPSALAQQAPPSIAARVAALWPATTLPAFPFSAGTTPHTKGPLDTLPASIATHMEWTRDGRGFFYTSTVHPSQLYYHSVKRGHADVIVYESPDAPRATVRGDMSSEGEYVIITSTPPGDPHTRVALIDLDDPDHPTVNAPYIKLYDEMDAAYHFAGSYGPRLFFVTDRDAQRGKVVSLDATDPRPATEHVALAEGDLPLISAHVVATHLFGVYRDMGSDLVRIFSLQGYQMGRVPLPSPGSVNDIVWGGRQDHDTAYIVAQSILTPPTLYAYATRSAQTTVVQPPAVAFDSAQYQTQLLRYDSAGNVSTTSSWSAYVTARKGIALDSSHRVWVDTAAAGDGPMLRFSPAAAVWIEQGGVYVVPDTTTPLALAGVVQLLVAQKYGTTETVMEGAAPAVSQGADATAAWLTSQLATPLTNPLH